MPSNCTVSFGSEKKYKKNDIVVVSYYSKVFNKQLTTILRIIGVPGDVIKIDSGVLYVNEHESPFVQTALLCYNLYFKVGVDEGKVLTKYGVKKSYIGGSYLLTANTIQELNNSQLLDSFKRVGFNRDEKQGVVLESLEKGWNLDYFGPIRITRKNEYTPNDEWKLYYGKEMYDNLINDEYYFLIADNFYQSIDSRIIGLVPTKNILGKIKSLKKSQDKKTIIISE